MAYRKSRVNFCALDDTKDLYAHLHLTDMPIMLMVARRTYPQAKLPETTWNLEHQKRKRIVTKEKLVWQLHPVMKSENEG